MSKIMDMSIDESLRIVSDDEILESSYKRDQSFTFGNVTNFNLVTPKRQQRSNVEIISSPMAVDVKSPKRGIQPTLNLMGSPMVTESITPVRERSSTSVTEDSWHTTASSSTLLQHNNKTDNSVIEVSSSSDSDVIELSGDSSDDEEKESGITLQNLLQNLIKKCSSVLDETSLKEKKTNNISKNSSQIVSNGKPGGGLSFLSSLSERTYDLKCDSKAEYYKLNFNNCKDALAVDLYKLFNQEVFENRLPKNLKIVWSKKLVSTAGVTGTEVKFTNGQRERSAHIKLSDKILNTAERLRNTLIHEMCHAAVWLINQTRESHGPIWYSWTRKARLVFPELPAIRRCHTYDINFKFEHKCIGCGYSIGRCRPSHKLLAGSRCGYCGCRFQLIEK